MNQLLNEVLLNRKNLIMLDHTSDSASEIKKFLIVATASKNLESLGYRFSSELINALKKVSKEEIYEIEDMILNNIQERLGDDVVYKPMYPGFPDSVMKKDEAELYFDAMRYAESGFTEMPLEYVLCKKESHIKEVAESAKKLTAISVGEEKNLDEIIHNLMSSMVTYSQNDKDDLAVLSQEYKEFEKAIPEKIPNKENLIWMANAYTQKGIIKTNPFLGKIKTATDVLRLIVARNDGDITLSSPTKFKKLPETEIKRYAELICKANNAEKDIRQRTEVFKRIFKQYHFPSVYSTPEMKKLAYNLYHDKLEKTFDSKKRDLMKNGNYNSLVDLYKSAPGRMATDMDHLLRLSKFKEENLNKLYSVFEKQVKYISTMTLLKMTALLEERTKDREYNIYSPNKGLSNPYIVANQKKTIPEEVANRIIDIANDSLKQRYSKKRPLGKSYVEKGMEHVKIPTAQRTNSQNAQTLPYGSQMNLEKGTDTIRGFIWWTNTYPGQNLDIDLSAVYFDKDWKEVGHVSYLFLRNKLGVHSGDIRDGGDPGSEGASEFIDFNLKAMKENNVAYVVFSVNNFSVYDFADTPCKFGWMELEKDPKFLYNPRDVKTAVKLNTKSSRSIPVVFDVENERFVWMDRNPRSFSDIKISEKGPNNVITHATPIMVECYKAVHLPAPSLSNLINLHIEARGEKTENMKEAESLFMIDRINDFKDLPQAKEVLCAYDNDAILGDLVSDELSLKDVEYFTELEKKEVSEKEIEPEK